ncbi:unnamed protein product [Arabis nemorensis]|uniref:Pentatricopeptide repeat-containing protein n=1 Tax=Arabis nemorensis TaxID=586526 RepID=A0A565CDR2_9BRAS|nr:unnamed protein product [Arabis nemorensis]
MEWYAENNQFDQVFMLFHCHDSNAAGQVHVFSVKLGFDRNPFPTVCNVLVKSYFEIGRRDVACVVFEQNKGKDSVLFQHPYYMGFLKAVVGLHGFVLGHQLHGLAVTTGFSRDVSAGNQIGRQVHCQAIVAMADSTPHVGNSFRLSQQSTVSWTALLSRYVQKGLHGAGLKLFTKMQGANLQADQTNFFATVLRASASFASLLTEMQFPGKL